MVPNHDSRDSVGIAWSPVVGRCREEVFRQARRWNLSRGLCGKRLSSPGTGPSAAPSSCPERPGTETGDLVHISAVSMPGRCPPPSSWCQPVSLAFGAPPRAERRKPLLRYSAPVLACLPSQSIVDQAASPRAALSPKRGGLLSLSPKTVGSCQLVYISENVSGLASTSADFKA